MSVWLSQRNDYDPMMIWEQVWNCMKKISVSRYKDGFVLLGHCKQLIITNSLIDCSTNIQNVMSP